MSIQITSSHDAQSDLVRVNFVLRDGRTLSIFVNRERNLLVVDVLDLDKQGGNEFVRKTIPPDPTSLAKKNATRDVAFYVGDVIYVGSSWYIDHGEDDVEGGWATISKLEKRDGTVFVTVQEHPGHSYNLDVLRANQERWAKEFGNQRARPDPDPPKKEK